MSTPKQKYFFRFAMRYPVLQSQAETITTTVFTLDTFRKLQFFYWKWSVVNISSFLGLIKIIILPVVIIFSAWLRLIIWVKGVSQSYRKIGPSLEVARFSSITSALTLVLFRFNSSLRAMTYPFSCSSSFVVSLTF